MGDHQPYVTIRSRESVGAFGARNSEPAPPTATHDISRTRFHVKHIDQFAKRLEDSAMRAFPNRGRSTQRYQNVQTLLLHWTSDDLFVFPEVEDLEKCLREDYGFETDTFAIPTENAHLELMMRLGQLIKQHESPDTLFVVYYGGHARIDESRQSTWCATRQPDSPWLQWSAIQTLLERSKSDVLILLDCCAGAASATFPTGNSITETISASSWDAIAPDPGRYSFTNALIEVLQEWRLRPFSAAMLHAEVLARLKHPRPITINGKYFEARSTPVHFMMTANHKAPSIEICRYGQTSDSPVLQPRNVPASDDPPTLGARGPCTIDDLAASEPNEDTPHVMISLALEDDQRLDINAWEQWLNAFPALAKYVKVQGVFKSHSTMMLVSMPVMIWSLLPEDHAMSFVAFIRSNNLAIKHPAQRAAVPASVPTRQRIENPHADAVSLISGTTFVPAESAAPSRHLARSFTDHPTYSSARTHRTVHPDWATASPSTSFPKQSQVLQGFSPSESGISRQLILNQQQSMRRTVFGDNVPEPKKFSAHVESRLESYYQLQPLPNDAEIALIASNLGIEAWHLGVWYHHRREREQVLHYLESLNIKDIQLPLMISPSELCQLLDTQAPSQMLVFDLRSSSDFETSHIHNAINLRVPRSFIIDAPLDLVQRAVAEDSREAFYKWQQAQCIIFYSDSLQYPTDCPSAALLTDKLTKLGWQGHSLLLKGTYEDFSTKFNKYIVGPSMTLQARNWSEQLQHNTPATDQLKSNAEMFSSIVSSIQPSQNPPPSELPQRQQHILRQEQALEMEFRLTHESLYKKVKSLTDTRTSEMVQHLDRGLDKIRHESKKLDDDSPDDYVEISREGHKLRRGTEEDVRRGRSGLLSKMLRRT